MAPAHPPGVPGPKFLEPPKMLKKPRFLGLPGLLKLPGILGRFRLPEKVMLPARLRKPESARFWGRQFGDIWQDEHRLLAERYRLLGEKLPAVTEEYLHRKTQLGRDLQFVRGDEWKKDAKNTFDLIKGIRKEPLYPLALAPLEVMKAERRAADMKRFAEKVKIYSTNVDYYNSALKRLEKDEGRLEELRQKMAIFIAKAHEAQKQKELENLLSDLERMEKHILTAKDYIFTVKRDILQKKQTADYARYEIKKGEHYAVFERKSYSSHGVAPEIPAKKKKKYDYL